VKGLKGEIAEDYLYDFINKHAGLSIYGLAKKLNWSSGKVYNFIERLEGIGLIRTVRMEEGGRLKRLVYSVHWTELLADDVKEEFFANREDSKTKKSLDEQREPSVLCVNTPATPI